MLPGTKIESSPAARLGGWIAIVFLSCIWLLPIIGVVLTSTRSIDDLQSGRYWAWPNPANLTHNYAQVLLESDIARMLLNSFLITVPSVCGTLALSAMAGFALAKYRFRGNVLIFALFVGGNLVPFQILAIPVRTMIIGAGLYDTIAGLIVFHISFQTGFATLFMRNFVLTIPDSIIEGARLDGLKEWQVLLYIVAPLLRPAMAAVAVLVFTFVWNDLFWSLVLTHSNSARPVTAGLQTLRGMWLTSWHLVSAAALMAAAPPAILFLTMQRHFIAGLTVGISADE